MKSVVHTAWLSVVLLSLLAAGPASREAAAEHFVGAADIYAYPNSATGIKTLMGQRVQVEVVVTIARDTPLVEIVKPADSDKARPIQAPSRFAGNGERIEEGSTTADHRHHRG